MYLNSISIHIKTANAFVAFYDETADSLTFWFEIEDVHHEYVLFV